MSIPVISLPPHLEEMLQDPKLPSIGSLSYSDPSRPKLGLTPDNMKDIGALSTKRFNEEFLMERTLRDAWTPGMCPEPDMSEESFPAVNGHPDWVSEAIFEDIHIVSCVRCGHTPTVLDCDDNDVFNPEHCDVVLVRSVMTL